MPGGRKPVVTDDEIIDLFHKSDEPFLTTMEVADEIDFAQRGAFQRLVALNEQGELQRKDAGTSAVWWCEQALKERYASGP